MQNSTPRGLRTLHLAFFLSGAAGLGYEIVWTRLFSTGLGHEYPSLLAVVAAFFGGVALGAWALDRPISRSRRPGRIYAFLELGIGLWSLATIWLIPRIEGQAAEWIGLSPSPLRHWLIAFAIPWVLLLPATVAMGATLPAVERLAARVRQDGRRVAGLYALNTLGAATGILAGHLWLIPNFGLRTTLAILAALNLLCAALVILVSSREEARYEEVETEMSDAPSSTRLRAIALATGLLGIGYEVLGIRVMSQILQNTVFSFAAALIAYLVGSAIGAALYQAKATKDQFHPLLERLLIGLSATTALGIAILSLSKPIYSGIRSGLGGTSAASMWAEFSLALLVFGLPAVLMGATFSHLMQAARQREGGVGAVLGVNTLGSALAPLVFAVGLMPWLGTKLTIALIAVAYLALCPLAPGRRLLYGLPALAIAFLATGPLWLVDAAGGRLVHSKEGRLAAVAVIDMGPSGHVLKVNDRFRMGGTGPGSFGARRLGHIPLLLHPSPEKALFLGVGTGITLASAAEHPGLKAIGVELLPEVVEVMGAFREGNAALLESKDVTVQVADARRFVTASEDRFDVIVADLFHPARDGTGSLYTLEHFRAIRERLAPGGLFCQWLPLHQMDGEVLRLILRTYLEVYPDSHAFLGWFNVNTPAVGLVGGLEPFRLAADHYERRVQDPDLRRALEKVALRDGLQLLGTYLASGEALAGVAGPGRRNTDDRPLIAYMAPEQVYRKNEDVHGHHTSLLLEVSQQVGNFLLQDGPENPLASDLADYLVARDLYLQAAQHRANGEVEQARDALLESSKRSPAFRTSYDALLVEAKNMASHEPEASKYLLQRLMQACPERPKAGALFRELFYSR